MVHQSLNCVPDFLGNRIPLPLRTRLNLKLQIGPSAASMFLAIEDRLVYCELNDMTYYQVKRNELSVDQLLAAMWRRFVQGHLVQDLILLHGRAFAVEEADAQGTDSRDYLLAAHDVFFVGGVLMEEIDEFWIWHFTCEGLSILVGATVVFQSVDQLLSGEVVHSYFTKL